jgi:dCTP deaminase
MYLSDRDLEWAVESGKLVVDPRPNDYGPSSIDLHLDNASQAKIWDIAKFIEQQVTSGNKRPELHIGTYRYDNFSDSFLKKVPSHKPSSNDLVQRRGDDVIVRPTGFLLWQTKEEVGTPPEGAELICFVDGKSTKSRAGMIVHLTAPTIHTSWIGHITLEIVNLGPFDLVLKEDDAIAQLTVARVTSCPAKGAAASSTTYGQRTVHGKAANYPARKRAAKSR